MFERLFSFRRGLHFKKTTETETVKLDFSMCKLEITLPANDYTHSGTEDGMKKFDIFDDADYKYPESPVNGRKVIRKTGEFSKYPIFRSGAIYEPMSRRFSVGSMLYSLAVGETSKLDQQINCFNRQHFEYITRYDAYFGMGPGAGFKLYKCPLNWRAIRINGTEWVYFESIRMRADWDLPDRFNSVRHYGWLMTPIFSDRYLRFMFSSQVPQNANMQIIMNRIKQIMDSVFVTLTPEAKKQQSEASSTQYSEQRGPENWQYCESFEYGDDGLEFHGEFSPPPQLN